MNQEPHNKPPLYPVLYIKPVNTWRSSGEPIMLPAGIQEVEVGATLGIVIGKTAVQVNEATAFSYIQGYLIANDVTIAHEKILRPPIKQKCRDSFCPMSNMVLATEIKNPNDFHISIYINDELRLQNSTKNLVRPIAKLLAEITKFMTLNEGDVVLVGTPENLPLARAGDKVSIEISCEGKSIGHLVNFVQQELVS
jgi:5-oxopent-3-ene-1,2,5-tricarboxylate decarboxylase/2-hydroxyhepta-2,4-diene-1,7-dioate isomerase